LNVEAILHRVYRDKIFGAAIKRPGPDELLEDCHRCVIDVVVVWKFDPFARSLKILIAGFEFCRSLGIGFVSVTEAVDSSGPSRRNAAPDDQRY
jgi:DNA invertase Pin-like site-specific DNA recombinase